MNGIVNRFLLVGDKFMPKMHLMQPGFTFSTCGTFTRNKKKKNIKIESKYQDEPDKACL